MRMEKDRQIKEQVLERRKMALQETKDRQEHIQKKIDVHDHLTTDRKIMEQAAVSAAPVDVIRAQAEKKAEEFKQHMRELEDQERAKLEEIKHLEKQVKHKATA